MNPMTIKRYAKFIVAAAAALGVLGAALVDDGRVSGAEWGAIASALLGALGVRQIPNAPMEDVPPPTSVSR